MAKSIKFKRNYLDSKGIVHNRKALDKIIDEITGIIVTDSNTDLDNYKESGIYFFDTNYVPENIPAGNNGWLVVLKGSGNFVKQVWYRAGTANLNDSDTYVRTNTGSWSSWRKYVTEDETNYKTVLTTDLDNEMCTFNTDNVESLNSCRLVKTGNICILSVLGKFVSSLENTSNLKDIDILTFKNGYRPAFTNFSQSVSIGSSLWGAKTPQFVVTTPEGVLTTKKNIEGMYFSIYYIYVRK